MMTMLLPITGEENSDINKNAQKWMRITLFNLLIVAVLGVMMRYKISFYFPFIQQKNFLHAHSHFAFTGWITQSLFVMMVAYLGKIRQQNYFKKYQWLLWANLITAYGMLFSFPWQGYGTISIIFSTLSIFVSYAFAFLYWKDLNKLPIRSVTHQWFKAAFIFNIISSIGAFTLAFMLANNIQHPTWYLATIYFFLHFQYNGWFFFACMGLFNDKLLLAGIKYSFLKLIFWLFAFACLPAYFLSALWLPIPLIVYLLVIMAALSQLIAWILLIRKFKDYHKKIFAGVTKEIKVIFLLIAIALSIKLLLQAGSTIPVLSDIAFGFRPVIIGYLHLVLLGVITLFLIANGHVNYFIITNRIGNIGLFLFILGIILNEFLLMVQGASYMSYINVHWINELLLGAAMVMFTGLLFLNIGLKKIR